MKHIAEIISVGTELLLGNIANTDAQDVSQALSELGIDTYYHTVVGDNPERVKAAVSVAIGRADIIIATGGLGPTYDDLTKQTLCEAFGKKLVFHEDIADGIREMFKKRLPDLPFTENNLQQAYLPEGCTVFHNTCGTAPGCGFEADGKHVLMLPGPPRECRAMLSSGAIPYLKALSDSEIRSHNIHIFGLGESAVEDRLRPIMTEMTNPTLAPYAKDCEVMLRLTAKAPTGDEAEALMAPVLQKVRDELGDIIYGVDTDSLENTVVSLLREKKLTVSSAESCTGGLFAKRITDIPGSSEVFKGSIVTYCNEAKTEILGVSADTIEKHGAVSRETAFEMAGWVRLMFKTDVGVSVTGLTGPDGDGSDTPVGTIFVGVAYKDVINVFELHTDLDRNRNRTYAVSTALDEVRRSVCGIE